MALPKVLTTSVVRAARRGQSHGGVYLVDLETGRAEVMLDWDSSDIDFTGRGGDRGLRGIAFDGDNIYIAASDEIFVFDRSFDIQRSYRNRYLKHCHEIAIYKDQLFITSTGYDSILVCNIRTGEFVWGVHVHSDGDKILARTFDPTSSGGPLLRTELHINSVFCNVRAVLMSGMRHDRIIRFREQGLDLIAAIPRGTHNVQMFEKGILFNDSASDHVRYARGTDQISFAVPKYRPKKIVNTQNVSERVARPYFARGLCPLGNGLIAAGSSPSTIAVHDLKSGNTVKSINLSMDVRNSIHGLEVWPYDS
jgi:hypothetical protein